MGVLSNNSNRRAYDLPADCKQDILDMLAEGLKPNAVARYIGVSTSTVKNIAFPNYYGEARKKWYLKNRERQLQIMREYSKNNKQNKKEILERRKEFLTDSQLQAIEAFKKKL